MLEWLGMKLVGVVVLLVGIFMIIFVPWTSDYQDTSKHEGGVDFARNAIILGLILVVIGGFMVFAM